MTTVGSNEGGHSRQGSFSERVRVAFLQRVRTILRAVQEYPELVLECMASGDDVGYSVVAIFCKRFGLSDGHCTVLHKDVVVNAVYLKQVSRSRLIRLAVWQLSTLLVIHHRDLNSAGMAPSGSSGNPGALRLTAVFQNSIAFYLRRSLEFSHNADRTVESVAVQDAATSILFSKAWTKVVDIKQLSAFAAVEPSDLIPTSLADLVEQCNVHGPEVERDVTQQDLLAAIACKFQQETAKHLTQKAVEHNTSTASPSADPVVLHPLSAFALLRSTLLLLKLIELDTSAADTPQIRPVETALWAVCCKCAMPLLRLARHLLPLTCNIESNSCALCWLVFLCLCNKTWLGRMSRLGRQ